MHQYYSVLLIVRPLNENVNNISCFGQLLKRPLSPPLLDSRDSVSLASSSSTWSAQVTLTSIPKGGGQSGKGGPHNPAHVHLVIEQGAGGAYIWDDGESSRRGGIQRGVSLFKM
jgi:hypothetical protein